MSWLGVLAYIIRQIIGTSFSEDHFRSTELAIILSSRFRISNRFASYESINQSTFSPLITNDRYNGHLLQGAVCLLITINNKTVSGVEVGGLATAERPVRDLDTLQFLDISSISAGSREIEILHLMKYEFDQPQGPNSWHKLLVSDIQ